LICQLTHHVPQNVTNLQGQDDVLCLRCNKLRSEGWSSGTYDGLMRGLRLGALGAGSALVTSIATDISFRQLMAVVLTAALAPFTGRLWEGARDQKKTNDKKQ